jgi:hypothetical protein
MGQMRIKAGSTFSESEIYHFVDYAVVWYYEVTFYCLKVCSKGASFSCPPNSDRKADFNSSPIFSSKQSEGSGQSSIL